MYRLTKIKDNFKIIVDSSEKSNCNIIKKVKYDDSLCYTFFDEISWNFKLNYKDHILICNPTNIFGIIYETTKKFIEEYSAEQLYVPLKFLNDPEAMSYIKSYVQEDDYSLYSRYSRMVEKFITITEYAKNKYGFISENEFDLELNYKISKSSDEEQQNLAKIIILTSSYDDFEKEILLGNINCNKLTISEINKLSPKIKDYVRKRVIDRISNAYRNVIQNHDIKIT